MSWSQEEKKCLCSILFLTGMFFWATWKLSTIQISKMKASVDLFFHRAYRTDVNFDNKTSSCKSLEKTVLCSYNRKAIQTKVYSVYSASLSHTRTWVEFPRSRRQSGVSNLSNEKNQVEIYSLYQNKLIKYKTQKIGSLIRFSYR